MYACLCVNVRASECYTANGPKIFDRDYECVYVFHSQINSKHDDGDEKKAPFKQNKRAREGNRVGVSLMNH